MIIAQDKRKTNLAEYILYMWQVEDIIRACNFNLDLVDNLVISKFNLPEDRINEVRNWYANLIIMLNNEGKQKKGHLIILNELVNDMNKHHIKLLNDSSHRKYGDLYLLAKPNIEAFKKKAGEDFSNDIEASLTALYGILLLKLKKEEVTADTMQASKTISNLLAYLSDYYRKIETGQEEF